MATRVIRIEKGNTTNGDLELTNKGNNEAGAGDTVLWQIDQNSKVKSITEIVEKKGSKNIFSIPPRPQGNNWTGDVSTDAKIGDEFIYTIHWIDEQNNPLEYDPKITVVPSIDKQGS
jgi:hypothetical protein